MWVRFRCAASGVPAVPSLYRPVSLLRRILVFAIGLMLLQGNLAAVMLPCATGHGVPARADATSDQDGAAGMALAHAAMGHGVASSGEFPAEAGEHECDHPEHPKACASMVSCIAVAAPEGSSPLGRRQPPVMLAIATKAGSPLSLSLPPDVPPPRV